MNSYDICRIGNFEIFKNFLDRGLIDINKLYKDNVNCFHTICNYGYTNDHIKILNFLLENSKIDINEPDDNGDTPFQLACNNGHIKIVNRLINESNLNFNKINKAGYTTFFRACLSNKHDVIKILLNDPRTDINKCENYNCSPFYFVCYKEYLLIISLFLNSNRYIIYKEYNIIKNYFDILKNKNINTTLLKQKISKNQKLLFSAADGDLLELKTLLKFKKIYKH